MKKWTRGRQERKQRKRMLTEKKKRGIVPMLRDSPSPTATSHPTMSANNVDYRASRQKRRKKLVQKRRKIPDDPGFLNNQDLKTLKPIDDNRMVAEHRACFRAFPDWENLKKRKIPLVEVVRKNSAAAGAKLQKKAQDFIKKTGNPMPFNEWNSLWNALKEKEKNDLELAEKCDDDDPFNYRIEGGRKRRRRRRRTRRRRRRRRRRTRRGRGKVHIAASRARRKRARKQKLTQKRQGKAQPAPPATYQPGQAPPWIPGARAAVAAGKIRAPPAPPGAPKQAGLAVPGGWGAPAAEARAADLAAAFGNFQIGPGSPGLSKSMKKMSLKQKGSIKKKGGRRRTRRRH